MSHKKLQVLPFWDDDDDMWKYIVISAGEYTTLKLKEGSEACLPVTAFILQSNSPSIMLEIDLHDGEAVSVRAIEL